MSRLARSRRAPVACFALVCILAGATIFLGEHGAFFRADDWDMMLQSVGLTKDTLLTPHVNHLVATQILFYEGMRSLAGWHYGAYRLVFVVFELAVATGVYVFARRRVGGWLAVALVVPLLLIPGEATAVFTTGNVLSLIAGLAALLVLDRAAPSHRRDAALCVLLLLSVASFSFGLAFCAAVAIFLVASPGQRRSLWVTVVPVVAYAWWLHAYHPPSPLSLHNLIDTPQFVAESAAAAFGAVTGLGFGWGRLMALVAAVAVGHQLVTRPERRSPMTYAIVALPLLLWALVGIGRAASVPAPQDILSDVLVQRLNRLNGTDVAGQARYVYPGVAALLLVGAQMLAGRRLSRPLLAIAGGLALIGVGVNLVLLRDTGANLRAVADRVRGRLAGVEIAQRTLPPQFGVANFPGGADPNRLYIANFQEPFFRRAVHDIGSEPMPLGDLDTLGPAGRSDLDSVLVAALPVAVAPSPPGRPPRGRAAGCTRVEGPSAATTALPVRGTATTIRAAAAPVTVYVRRFADSGPGLPLGTVGAGASGVLTIPRDRSPRPWSMRVESAARVLVCSGPAAA